MIASFTDQQLLARIAESDRKAFEIVYRKYWMELYNAAFRRLKNSGQAQDIVQDIFVKLWERSRNDELQIDDLAAYLHTAVRYRIYNFISRDLASASFYEPFESIAANPSDADATLIEKELLRLADDYIAALPKKRQAIFSLYVNENLSTEEIAARLDISRKTVQNQLRTTMNGLRKHIIPLIALFLHLPH